MADTKISALTALAGADIAPDDVLPIVDTSLTTTKKTSRQDLQTYNAGTLTTDVKALDLSATWNNAGVTFSGLKFNVTDTASAAASLLMDLRVGGVSKFTFSKAGFLLVGANGGIDSAGVNNSWYGVAFKALGGSVIGSFGYSSGVNELWISGATSRLTFNNDVYLHRDAAATLAQRNGTNAQTFHLYNTYTDASNYERGFMRWNANVLEIGGEKAGTGASRTVFYRGATGTNTGMEITTNDDIGFRANSSVSKVFIRNGEGVRLLDTYQLGWSTTDPGSTAPNTAIARSASGVLKITNGSTGGGALEFLEQTAPAAGSANTVRIYAQDNGAGKTQLMALFATGAAQQIAIEP